MNEFRYPLNYLNLQAEVGIIRRPTRLHYVGLLGEECCVAKHKKYLKKIVFEGISHEPYQLVYLESVYGTNTDWILPREPDSVSHLCGDKRCVNASHMLGEPLNTNIGRVPCHNALKDYYDNNGSPNGRFAKLTWMSCFNRPCKHTIQCFISVGRH